jgi:hypothetical protein
LSDMHPFREHIDSLPSGGDELACWILDDLDFLQIEHKYREEMVRLLLEESFVLLSA